MRVHPRNGQDIVPPFEAFTKELQRKLGLSVKESPLLTFAVAGAVGYVLGGGLTPGILARVVGFGVRTAVALRGQQAIADWIGMGTTSDDS
jgi:hypothetical protein